MRHEIATLRGQLAEVQSLRQAQSSNISQALRMPSMRIGFMRLSGPGGQRYRRRCEGLSMLEK
jgi:hypothetical protein